MSHPNAALTPRHRLIVGRLVVDEGWMVSEVTVRFQVSWPTVKRWADRYRAGQPMQDRSSRPPPITKQDEQEDHQELHHSEAAPAGGAGAVGLPTGNRCLDRPPHAAQRHP